jgi:ComF family protein
VHLRELAGDFLDFCYPNRCASCDAPAGEGEGEGRSPLCEGCMKELEKLECAPACDRCAMPVPEHGSPCPHCGGKGLYPFSKVLRLATYHDPLRHLVHRMKYEHQWPLGEHLAERLLAQERVKGILHETQVLVAVPLHRFRQISRGFNQARVIADRLGKLCKIDRATPLVRLRNTETQTILHSRVKRVENLKEAFGLVDSKHITGKHVVLIDDVMTSGATLQAAGRALLEAKPASLCAIVVAIADPLRQDFQAI